MTLATLHDLAATNPRVFDEIEYTLAQALLHLFPQLQEARCIKWPPATWQETAVMCRRPAVALFTESASS